MKNLKLFLAVCLMMVIGSHAVIAADIVSAKTGDWNTNSTWVGGVVPGPSDNVTIASGHTVTVNIPNAECNNLTCNGYLYFALTNGNGITIYGDVVVNSTGRFRTTGTYSGSGVYNQFITIYGNLTVNSGGQFDMRLGSNPNVTVGRVTFAGSTNSIINLSLTTYNSSVEEFNSVEIKKTDGAKVILLSGNLYMSNNTTYAPDTLILTSGIIETGSNNAWIHLATSSSAVVGGSNVSYIKGRLGRGIVNTYQSPVNRFFEIGDENGYRPITIRAKSGGTATGHYVIAEIIAGNANPGNSQFYGDIDKVSEYRYYKITYFREGTSPAPSMQFDRFTPSYRDDDGVTAGNMNLRVALDSIGNRATWIDIGPLDHTTSLNNVPTPIGSDSVLVPFTVSAGNWFNIALARKAGTTENPLPIQLVSFVGNIITSRMVKLEWQTISEVNNLGFYVEKFNEAVNNFVTVSDLIPGAGTTLQPQTYSWIDENAVEANLQYRLKQVDLNGLVNYFGPIMLNPTGVIDKSVPAVFALHQNYPNPFNPTTTIKFSLAEANYTTLKVYDLLGSEVATLYAGEAEAGKLYSVKFDGSSLTSGIYLYKLQSGNNVEVKKLILMK